MGVFQVAELGQAAINIINATKFVLTITSLEHYKPSNHAQKITNFIL